LHIAQGMSAARRRRGQPRENRQEAGRAAPGTSTKGQAVNRNERADAAAPGSKPAVTEGAVPAAALSGRFPSLGMALEPPIEPLEAKVAERLPEGGGWLYEPKWDGFRCLLFRRGRQVVLQSKSGQALGRYFPELTAAATALTGSPFVLDGEIVVWASGGRRKLDFDALLQRIHPAASRIRRLASETPATLILFDLLLNGRQGLVTGEPLERRRERLERFASHLPAAGRFLLSPATTSRVQAAAWLRAAGPGSTDGVMAKRLDAIYRPGDRSAMVKVKPERTADCVVGGFRWARAAAAEDQVGSLLLGLYDEKGGLNHVGFCSGFTAAARRELAAILRPHIGSPGFTGRAPGGPSRWSRHHDDEWVPLRPVLVCEVSYDHFSGERFRHGVQFRRWRPDKRPVACTYMQLRRRPVPDTFD
jgi:ATP-dependent DNA ligase